MDFAFRESTSEKEAATRKPATLVEGRQSEDITEFGRFVCPACGKNNYVAYADSSRVYGKHGSCVWCGALVYYRREAWMA